MLPSKNRLRASFFRKNQHFWQVKISGADFALNFRRKPKVFRAAVVIAKKVIPKAVDRNRLKRLVYESLKNAQGLEGEIVIFVKKNLASLKKQDVEAKLKKLISKIR